MLDSFRKRDAKKDAYPRPQSPYGEMQAALSPARADDPKDTRTVDQAKAAAAAQPQTEKGKAMAADHKNIDTDAATGAKVSKLIVGPDIKLKGAEITDCDTLVVEGRVEASMDSRVIQIAENGVFVGKVDIDVAEIRGRFEGELVARKQLVIHSTGYVSGKIRYGKITVEEGGELLGDVAALASNGLARTAVVPNTNANGSANTSEFVKSDAVGALFKAANQR
jgi:cytoskeletal protein CcmA (bactofilin family)